MERRDLKSIYADMVEYFSPKPEPTDNQCNMWLREMGQFKLADVESMLAHMKKNGRNFPTINECVALADSMAFNRRHEEHKAAKKEERQRHEPKDDQGKKALRAMEDLFSGKVTRAEYVQRCEALGHNMSKLKGYYAEHRMDLAQKAQGAMVRKEVANG